MPCIPFPTNNELNILSFYTHKYEKSIILNNGERVKNKRTFLLAKEENRLVQGFDYIISSHSDAVLSANIKYRIDLITPDEYSDVLAFIDKYHLLWLEEENNHHVI